MVDFLIPYGKKILTLHCGVQISIYSPTSFASSQPQFSQPTSVCIQTPEIAQNYYLKFQEQDQEALNTQLHPAWNLLPHILF